jgi:hypothetical protein
MKKTVLCVIGGVVGGMALVSALGMKNVSADVGAYQLVPLESPNGNATMFRIDTQSGDVWRINDTRTPTGDLVKFQVEQ